MKNSFIIVTWNNEEQISKLIKSIQRYEPASTIIVVDNNSKDNTVAVVQKYKNVICLPLDENLGFAKANNIGFQLVKTDYVTFINPDTQLVSPVINKLINKINKTNAALIGGKLINTDGTLQPSIFKFQTPIEIIIEQFGIGKILPEKLKLKYSPENSFHNHDVFTDWLVGAFYFTKSKYYKLVGGFSEDYFLYAEDMDICYKYHLNDLKVLFTPEITIYHLGGESEKKTNTTKSLKLLESFCIFARKYNFSRNIFTLYKCYIIKQLIFRFINKTRANRYASNVKYLKGQLK